MGIRPRDQIARDAGLRCDMFGGIEVDDDLLTSDPAISAVGECARHKGMSYGLVAPGYAMAEAVARRLAGGEAKFRGAQIGTRLKVPGVELTVVGESQATGLGLRSHVFQGDGVYRRLALKRGRVVGITAVGDWDDLPRAQDAMARAEKLKPRQLERFKKNEPVWKSGKLSLHTWPDSATVCNCMGVTCGALRRAQREGCANVEALAQATGASTICGSCRPLLSTLTDPKPEEPDEPSYWMVGLSLASLIGALVFLFIPAVPYSDSVQAESIDFLWRSGQTKQITGFTLAGLFASSIVFSMRKRFAWFRWGDFEGWRVTHALLGVLCLVGGFAHTGFRLGSNLDFALVLVLLGSILLGGLAGGWSLIEAQMSPERGRVLRALLIRSHIYFLWPLPVLLVAHVTKVYFF
jgi:nitrite reductase (NADH) large subunit